MLFFIPYGAFHDAVGPDGTDLADHKVLGVTVATCLIIVVTLRVCKIYLGKYFGVILFIYVLLMIFWFHKY